MTCIKPNATRVLRMTTWQVLEEVDKLMEHVPTWRAFNWHDMYVTAKQQVFKNQYQRGLKKRVL